VHVESIYIHLKYQQIHLVFKILYKLIRLKHFKNIHRSRTCFGCYFSTIIREPQSSAKLTYVRCIHGDSGVVTACRFMWLMFPDMLRTGYNVSGNITT